MENHRLQWENQRTKWSISSSQSVKVYQRVSIHISEVGKYCYIWINGILLDIGIPLIIMRRIPRGFSPWNSRHLASRQAAPLLTACITSRIAQATAWWSWTDVEQWQKPGKLGYSQTIMGKKIHHQNLGFFTMKYRIYGHNIPWKSMKYPILPYGNWFYGAFLSHRHHRDPKIAPHHVFQAKKSHVSQPSKHTLRRAGFIQLDRQFVCPHFGSHFLLCTCKILTFGERIEREREENGD